MGLNLDMTLREFFELSERMAAAARVIRESQAALGAPVMPRDEEVEARMADAYVHRVPAPIHGIPNGAPPAVPVVQWSPEEQAIRARLRAEREAASKKIEEVVLESRQ